MKEVRYWLRKENKRRASLEKAEKALQDAETELADAKIIRNRQYHSHPCLSPLSVRLFWSRPSFNQVHP